MALKGLMSRSVLGLAVGLALVASPALAGPGDSANQSGTVNGTSYSATDSNGDGIPESITFGSVIISGFAPGSQFDITDGGVTIRVCVGTTGNDTIDESNSPYPVVGFGGPGDDDITGSSSQENDLYGGTGDDTLTGGSQADTLTGGSGDDGMSGGGGDDFLSGDHGNDTLDGGDGDDQLVGGAGNDSCGGGSGDDTFTCHHGGTDTYDGGAGSDSFDGTDGEGGDNYNYGSADQAPDTGDADGDPDGEGPGVSDGVNAGAGDTTNWK